MKKILIILFSLTTITSSAQEPTNSAAKAHYKLLMKEFEKLKNWPVPDRMIDYVNKVEKCKEKIGLIKQYDPSYNASAIESEYEIYAKKAKESSDAKQAGLDNAHAMNKELDELLKAPSKFYSNKTIEECKTNYNNYISFAKTFFDSNGKARFDEAKKNVLYRNPSDFDDEKNGYDLVLADIENSQKTANETTVHATHFKLMHYQSYWQTVYTLYNEPQYKENLDKTNALLQKLGGLDKMLEKMKQRDKEQIAKKRMPSAVRNDATTIKLFETSFYAMVKQMGWDDKIIKINLLHSDWTINRNQITGVIIGRQQSASISTTKNGKCVVYDAVHLYQNYDGKGYVNSHCGANYLGPEELLCEYAK